MMTLRSNLQHVISSLRQARCLFHVKRLVVLGGGPIGCELAQSFAHLGSQITQVEMATRIMIREDEEVSALAQTALEKLGIQSERTVVTNECHETLHLNILLVWAERYHAWKRG